MGDTEVEGVDRRPVQQARDASHHNEINPVFQQYQQNWTKLDGWHGIGESPPPS
jgi:hypothetical protein